ncbi:malate synthase G [Thalassotalea sp. G2M2-11]|uniref:malate synthase G n=1 Tax=Thalassotalea sp. G2M2-11 TaxID=2787627 RepID=UPI0019D0EE64|nr:malate synthase G [Thalassotalea sp. G2M2-11]
MSSRIKIAKLNIASSLHQFIEQEVLADLPLSSEKFWQGFSDIIYRLTPINLQLLATRDSLQQQIDHWHQAHQDKAFDFSEYKTFLKDIGYLAEPVEDFNIATENVDKELATMAGPQLVVPIMNARFALNAVNARWGSLYDALYGTDIIPECDGAEKTGQYNPVRGAKVIAFARDFLDQHLPLISGSHHDVKRYCVSDQQLTATLTDGQQVKLAQPQQFLGYQGDSSTPSALLLQHNGLHFEININPNNEVGKNDLAGVCDITLESALTTIMDCEDSVAAVDAQDKVIAYRHWLGLNKGTLAEEVTKNNQTFTRRMAADRQYLSPTNEAITLKGRSLMFVRNVGHLMTNNAILLEDGQEVPEGIMDAMITSLISLYDIEQKNGLQNSAQGSIYIVKPKMHGPEEVAFANTLFEQVEDALALPRNTIKMGIMDEERRTSVNLKACIYQAIDRVVFINTGFLDRTGDEIHTSMYAGPMERKADIKLTPWINAYEDNNVDVGLACGFSGKAQIGKGMWPIPDQMANMLANKINHVEAGANTAWVPSPTAATLHALHYHRVDVFDLQKDIAKRAPANLDDILTIPVAKNPHWCDKEITQELDNNAQGILGYVVRWIDQGIGCSKVPDINNVGLMEDRATLRISSQHITNWLQHNICTKEQVMASLEKMAAIVDQQNNFDPLYQPIAEDFQASIAFQSACDLIFKGKEQPNGYTEPLLHQYRLQKKQA